MSEFYHVLAGYLLALVVSAASIPFIIQVCRKLNLFAIPNGRSAGQWNVPTLGGLAIFMGFILGTILTFELYFIQESIYIFTVGLVMLITGLNDDVAPMSAKKKLMAELFIAAILIFWGDFRITSLHGFLGITTLPYFPGVVLTFFVYVVIINAFNLVDGIDGLAAGLGIFTCSVLGGWFYLAGHTGFAIIAFSLAGGLSGFFYYNVYGKENKIFMGDTGSLVVGTILAVLVIQFNEFNIDQAGRYAVNAAPAVSFGLLIYPLLDTLRVFFIRVMKNRSPFEGDRNHVHHRLLALGMSHRKATYWILTLNAFFTLAVFSFQWFGIFRLMAFNILVGGFYLLMPSYILGSLKKIPKDDPYQQIILFSQENEEDGGN